MPQGPERFRSSARRPIGAIEGVPGTAAYAIAFCVRWCEPTVIVVLLGWWVSSVTAGVHRCA
jgi:hypothetical protein